MGTSLKWFKSELAKLKLKEQKIKNDMLHKKLEKPVKKGKKVVYEKPYSKLTLVNDVLTVVLPDGDILSKSNATLGDFNSIRESVSYTDILSIIATSEVVQDRKDREQEVEKAKRIIKGIDTLAQFPDFDVKNGSLYLSGTSRSIPELLVTEFLEIVESYEEYSIQQTLELLEENEKYQALKRFFLWCCLNPRAEVADDLYDFLKNNSFRITKQGFFVALRNIVNLADENRELVAFISNTYNKIKAVWKKSPTDYMVCQTEGGEVEEYDEDDELIRYGEPTYYFAKVSTSQSVIDAGDILVGSLQTLYDDLPNMQENRFTDAHTHTFDIRIGKEVIMDPALCSWSTVDCGEGGLHFTADQINYVGCGDTSVLVLINPMKIVGIGSAKGRCYAYLPIMIVPRGEVTEILHDGEFDTLQLDEQYAIDELKGLEERIKNGFVAETTKHDFNLPGISASEISGIVASLEEMKDEISGRVSDIE